MRCIVQNGDCIVIVWGKVHRASLQGCKPSLSSTQRLKGGGWVRGLAFKHCVYLKIWQPLKLMLGLKFIKRNCDFFFFHSSGKIGNFLRPAFLFVLNRFIHQASKILLFKLKHFGFIWTCSRTEFKLRMFYFIFILFLKIFFKFLN